MGKVKIVKIIITAIVLLLVILYVRLELVNNYTLRIASSESMEPVVEKGSINVIEKCDIGDIKVGDIVCYKYNGEEILHRVISVDIKKRVLTTKGDNNKYSDNVAISNEILVGRLIKSIYI
jgi:signal peptidase I